MVAIKIKAKKSSENKLGNRMNYFSALILFLSICSHLVAQPIDHKSFEFKINPKNLPPCPSLYLDHYSKEKFGYFGVTKNWDKCWGKYVVEEKNINGFYFAGIGSYYEGEWVKGYLEGYGTTNLNSGDSYVGEMTKGMKNGWGILSSSAIKYIGQFINDKKHGLGILIDQNGNKYEGVWSDDYFVRTEKVNFPSDKQKIDVVINDDRRKLDADRQAFEQERKKLEENKRQREQAAASQRLTLQVSNTSPDGEGDFTIDVKTSADTASLKINGIEQGGKPDGNYSIKRVARAGQTSTFTIIAKDVFGNTDTKTLSVSRAIADSSNKYSALNPAIIKNRTSPDAVAIIIGIQNYRRVPKADFASDDAKDFYDYAIRALGIKPENIKLLIDDQADDVEILATFQSWLPVKVRKQKSDVYVFYSGHGLPSEDGKNLYFLPYGTDKQYLERTALNQQTIVTAIQTSQPKSVTMFIDACYSGQSRTGETLLSSARPISLKQSASSFPPEFTVFSASAPDQLSSSSPELKHGVFSYYLMKGMEGDADENRDGKITNNEMQNYLRDMVSRQALTLNRKQEPQLMGDAGKVLVGR